MTSKKTPAIFYHSNWASTLDKSDVDVMKDRIAHGANLLETHIFQFDFLNDDFANLPEGLRSIINDPEKRKKLVIFINPPYAEATNAKTIKGTGKNKEKVATQTKTYQDAKKQIGNAAVELFAQFFFRIYRDMKGAILGEFSTLKALQAPNFKDFRQYYNAKLIKLFIVPADTFDNVNGQFPIGFFIWNTSISEPFNHIQAEVFRMNNEQIDSKVISCPDNSKLINSWIKCKFVDNLTGGGQSHTTLQRQRLSKSKLCIFNISETKNCP